MLTSGLSVNYSKSAAVLIRGKPAGNLRVANILDCVIAKFPIKYLGLQLSIHPLTRVQWQPMLDAVKGFVPGWQCGFLQISSRLVLVHMVIAARPVHHLLVMDTLVWVWWPRHQGFEAAGYCAESVMGVLRRTQPSRPWQGLELIQDETAAAVL